MIGAAALALAILALLLSGFAVVQVFRLAGAIRALSRGAYPPPPPVPWPPPAGADATAVAQAALANAPDLFADARRQQAIFEEAAPSSRQEDVLLHLARASTCPSCGGMAGSRPAFGTPAHHREDCELMAILREQGLA